MIDVANEIVLDSAAEERFWAKVSGSDYTACWTWTAATHPDGYGSFWAGRLLGAHRVAWTIFNGPIPGELIVDHLCRSTACVNPWHMDLVTHRVNVLRGENAASLRAWRERGRNATHCSRGHELVDSNVRIDSRGSRRCKECSRENLRAHRARMKKKDAEANRPG